jgi:hypothetical protein
MFDAAVSEAQLFQDLGLVTVTAWGMGIKEPLSVMEI